MSNIPIGIKAEYTGDILYSYEMPKYKDVAVYFIYETDDTKVRELGWVYEKIVIQNNSFVFTIKHSSFYCELIVPIYANTPLGIYALYLGPPLLVGTKYDTSNLYVDLLLKDGTIKVLKFGDYTVSDTLVAKAKNNIYEIDYAGLKDNFFVYGYKLKDTVDLDFKVFLIHDNKYEEDVTDMFYNSFYDSNIERIYVTVNNMNKILFNSNYRILLPKETGMYQKYSTEWLITKTSTSVVATLNHVFSKEV